MMRIELQWFTGPRQVLHAEKTACIALTIMLLPTTYQAHAKLHAE